jgi:RNA polymerase-binding protein DksA
MLSAEQKKQFEARLLAEQAHLLQDLSKEQETLAGEHPGYSSHMADDATEVFEQAKNLALRQNTALELEMVQLALNKLRQGDFGLCERCGQPVESDRLEAWPHVRYCLSCQKALEERS